MFLRNFGLSFSNVKSGTGLRIDTHGFFFSTNKHGFVPFWSVLCCSPWCGAARCNFARLVEMHLYTAGHKFLSTLKKLVVRLLLPKENPHMIWNYDNNIPQSFPLPCACWDSIHTYWIQRKQKLNVKNHIFFLCVPTDQNLPDDNKTKYTKR